MANQSAAEQTFPPRRKQRVTTPTVLQMEAVECGAAALGIILGHYGKFVPLEELRLACGVSRDGSKASNMVKAARSYGLQARGLREEPEGLLKLKLPLIVFWNFNHFLVLEGYSKDKIYLNDPAAGPRTVTPAEFEKSFTGVVLTFEVGPEFKPGGGRRSSVAGVVQRLKGSETALVYLVLASLALVVMGLVTPVFTRLFIDKYLVNGANTWVAPVLIGLVLAAAFTALFTYLQQVYLLRLQTKLALTTSSNFFWHVLRLPISFFLQRQSGDISMRQAINDQVAMLLTGGLATNLLGVGLIVFYALLMFKYNVILTVIVVAIAMVNVVVLRYVARLRTDQNRKLLQERGLESGTASSGMRAIESMKASGTESDFFARWAGYDAKVQNAQQAFGFTSQVVSNVPNLLLSLNTVAILGVGGYLVIQGHLTIGGLTAFQALVGGFMNPINGLVSLGTQIQELEGNVNRLDDVLRYPVDPQVDNAGVAVLDGAAPAKLVGSLEIKNVTFGYSRLGAPLIEDFSLSVRPGARVALIGGSGSGKSTVARLVAGLYEPWSGEICIDGKPRREIPNTLLTNSLAIVDQDIALFEGTVRDNITMWDPSISETDVLQAAKDASIYAEIASRPHGFSYMVEEDGRNFSGGQRQRLEIARALAINPTILVLDEATSALDPVTEKLIDDQLRRRGCTCLIIAHRLSTIRDCDEIIVMERGKVVQRGTHDQMRRVQGSPYVKLMRAGESSKVKLALEDL